MTITIGEVAAAIAVVILVSAYGKLIWICHRAQWEELHNALNHLKRDQMVKDFRDRLGETNG